MAEFASYDPGTPSWIDLATTDLDGAKAFYMGLFGWTAADSPSPEGIYTMFSKDDFLVAAAYEMSADMIENQIPPHWATYITVASVDETLAKVEESGGSTVQPARDVPDSGRTAAVQDPAAAVFALWEPHGHVGAQLANQAGALIWNELQNYDTDAAAAFYEAVFGWSARVDQMPSGDRYTSFMLGERPVAGMMAIQPDWGPVPPNWSVYIGVENAQAACDYTAANRGSVEFPPMDVPGAGKFALLQDPQGAHFYVMEPVS